MCDCETRLAALEGRVAELEQQVGVVSDTAYEALGTAGAATFTAQKALASAATSEMRPTDLTEK